MIVCADNMDPERGLPSLADASVDAIVTDPPAGIAFMGKAWDTDKGGRDQWIAWLAGVMRECLRVLKPGGHALVWALPRTSHWTATAVEDAGFEIRDVVVHLNGQGFPKSLDVSKAIDKAAGAERADVYEDKPGVTNNLAYGSGLGVRLIQRHPATPAAAQWSGWGTALKPAAEHWILARKPLDGTVANCVLKHGTGALNIDGTRISTAGESFGAHLSNPANRINARAGQDVSALQFHKASVEKMHAAQAASIARTAHLGRWPANVTLDEEAARALDEQSGTLKSGAFAEGTTQKARSAHSKGSEGARVRSSRESDSGGASRFFYVAKGSRAEKTHGGTVDNKHPTVKSIALMRWLVRLITPPGGLVLDPFAGSGTTGVAALAEGMRFMGMERDAEYATIAAARIATAEAA